ncbi:MAG: hypothetical protein CMK59_05945 [Proteobacteria bacterium]|nr:hypothetical protein [Pseudomonadota bacterium]
MLRHFAQKFIRTVAEKVSEYVARDDLFEQVGERLPTVPLNIKEEDGRADSSLEMNKRSNGFELDEQLFDFVSAQNIKIKVGTLDRPKIVHHWASWCEGCISELSVVNDLSLMLKDQVEFIAVSWDLFQHQDRDRAVKDLQSLYDEHQLSFSTMIVEDEPTDFFETFDLSFQQIPQTWVCSADGEILYRCEEDITIPKIEDILGILDGLKGQS